MLWMARGSTAQNDVGECSADLLILAMESRDVIFELYMQRIWIHLGVASSKH
jgi:hypothetical protein